MINKIELIAYANGDTLTQFSERVKQYLDENTINARLGKSIIRTENRMISKYIVNNSFGDKYKIQINGKIPNLDIIQYLSRTNKVTDFIVVGDLNVS